MQVVKGFPPNYAEIDQRFGLSRFSGAIFFFAYGDRVYTQRPDLLMPALRAHEGVHLQQQAETTPPLWWEQYLSDDAFRLEQERQAHVAELAWHRANGDHGRNGGRWRQVKHSIVSKLSHPAYGPMCDRVEAKRLLGLM